MPPSGYSPKQSRYVVELLCSCAEALIEEARHHGWTVTMALDNELTNIRKYLQNEAVTSAQGAVLHVTEAFYQKLRATNPIDISALRRAAPIAASEIQAEILAIKIPLLV